jgi:hypothetical protein
VNAGRVERRGERPGDPRCFRVVDVMTITAACCRAVVDSALQLV